MIQLEQLKKYVLTSHDLNEPFNYFFDLMERNLLMTVPGHQLVNAAEQRVELMAVVNGVKRQLVERFSMQVKKMMPILYEIPSDDFYHGTCMVDDSPFPMALIYFADVQTGIYAVTIKQKTEMVRFAVAGMSGQ